MEAVPQETVEKLMGNVPAQKELEGSCIHGGFVSTMLEIAAGMATYAYGESNVAVSCATNFVRAVRPQRLTVSADTSHKGRSTSVAHCAIVDEHGRLVAESTFTMFFLGPLES